MDDDFLGNCLYFKLGDSATIVYNEGSENLYVRVFDGQGGYSDHYTTAAGTKTDWLSKQSIGRPSLTIDPSIIKSNWCCINVCGEDAIAMGNSGGAVESGTGNGNKGNVTGDILIDTFRGAQNLAAQNPGWTGQQAYDEEIRQIKEKEWNAGYKIFIQYMADSGTLQQLQQRIADNEWVITNYRDSGIPVDEHLDYLIKYLSNKQGDVAVDLTAGWNSSITPAELGQRVNEFVEMITSPGVAGGSVDRQDEYTLNEAVDSGYEWSYSPIIGFYRTKAGIVHYEDLEKFEKMQKVIEDSLQTAPPWGSIKWSVQNLSSMLSYKERKDWEIATHELTMRGVTPENNPEYNAELENEYKKQKEQSDAVWGFALSESAGSLWSSGKVGLTMLKGSSKAAEGILKGSVDGLTVAERKVVGELVSQGKTVEIIPKTTQAKTPDFFVDAVKTELKTLQNPNTGTGMKRIQEGFGQGAEKVIIDARESGLTSSQAQEIINRALGKYPGGQLPGHVEIWTGEGIITYIP